MRRNDTVYNIVSVVFLLLSLTLCLISAAWLSDSISVPEFLAPSTTVPLPTARPEITFTPSFTPEPQTPTRTPFPSNTPAGSEIPLSSPTPTETSVPETEATFEVQG